MKGMPVSQRDTFDPYLEWLNISPARRPPTYYDLLGLSSFESNPHIIREHASARYALIHQYQAGRRGEAAVGLLAELALARDVLCDPQRKAQYDAALASRNAATSSAPGAAPQVAADPPLGTTPSSPPAQHAARGGLLPQAAQSDLALRGMRRLAIAVLLITVGVLIGWLLPRGDVRRPHARSQQQEPQRRASQPERGWPSASPVADAASSGTTGARRRTRPEAQQPHRGSGNRGRPATRTSAAHAPTRGNERRPQAGPTDAADEQPHAASPRSPRSADSTQPGTARDTRASPPSEGPGELPPHPWQQTISLLWETPAHAEPLNVLPLDGTQPSLVALNSDGSLLACGTRRGAVHVWSVGDARLLFTLDAHVDQVLAMAFSPDGKLLATAGLASLAEDNRGPAPYVPGVRFWRLNDGVLYRQILGLPAQPLALAFSADSRDLAAALANGTVSVWRVAKRQLLRRRVAKAVPFAFASFSPNGQLLAAGSGNAVGIWRAADGELVANHQVHSPIYRLAFNHDGTALAMVCENGNLEAWLSGAEGGTRTFTALAQHPGLGEPGLVRPGEPRDQDGVLRCGQFTPDGKLLLGAGSTHLACFDATSGRLISAVPCVDVEALAISPDGAVVVCAHDSGEVSIWPIGGGRGLAVSSSHTASITALACSQDGALVASGGREGMVSLWRASDGRLESTLAGLGEDGPLALAFCGHGGKLAVVCAKHAAVWRLNDGQWTGHLVELKQPNAVFSPDGRTLAVAENNTIKVREAETLLLKFSHQLKEATVSSIAVSSEGTTVALGLIRGSEHLLALQSTSGGAHPLAAHDAVVAPLAISSDGRLVACAVGHRLYVYDVSDGQCRCTIDCAQDVRSLAFSPDGRTLACAVGNRVLLYSTPEGDSLASIDAHAAAVTALVFAADGSWLASGGEDGLLRIWRPSTNAGVPDVR